MSRICKNCGLPLFSGSYAYAGDVCKCVWQEHQKNKFSWEIEIERLRAELAAARGENNNLRNHRNEAIDDAREFREQLSRMVEKADALSEQLAAAKEEAEMERSSQKQTEKLLHKQAETIAQRDLVIQQMRGWMVDPDALGEKERKSCLKALALQPSQEYLDAWVKEQIGEPAAYQNSRNGFIAKENKNPEYNVPLYAIKEKS